MAEPVTDLPVGVFLPDHAVAHHIMEALTRRGFKIAAMPDPLHLAKPWLETALAAIIFDPFRTSLPVEATVMMVRGMARTTPMLAVTPADCAIQRTRTLVCGADDSIYGLGDRAEIAARLSALIRRTQLAASGVLRCDDLEIDMLERRVCRAGRSISMPLREFDLLAHLARRADRPVSRTALLSAVWNLHIDPGTNRVDVHMSRLRQRVDRGHAHAMLRTIKGTGYALVTRGGVHGPPSRQPTAIAMQHLQAQG